MKGQALRTRLRVMNHVDEKGNGEAVIPSTN